MAPNPIHPAAQAIDRLLVQCEVRRQRRAGPGGQHRNKVETAIVITHRPSGVRGEASERRSQAQNRRMALFRLRVNLALQQRRGGCPPARPSDLWRSRCAGGRLSVSAAHDDFPALLAEALDALYWCDLSVKRAAQAMGCTTSQMIKLLKLEPRAMQLVNDQRRRRRMRPLQ